ncbi:MAG: hypothetical protein ACLGQH_04340 [Acidobacteriota bacterium]
MQLVICNGAIVATHLDGQDIAGMYPDGIAVHAPNGTPAEIGQPWMVDLDIAKAAVCAEIDARAEKLRNSVLTPGAGQMAAYQEKERQARLLLADAAPTEGEYPDIFNEIGITADSAGEVAMAVLAASERWRDYGRSIERARLAGKKTVGQATDIAAILAARDGIAWR